MTSAEARTAVKDRLDIDSTVTAFDDFIDDAVDAAVNSFYPIAQKEVAAQTKTITVDDYGEAIVDLSALSTPLTDVRTLEVSAGAQYSDADDYHVHGVNLYIRDLDTSITSARIFGLVAYSAIADIPDHLTKAIIWYAMAEFYDFLAGNKRYYNLYNTAGARQVDNMRDEAEYFEGKANAYLSDRATLYGRS